jgi:predicted esterase
MNRRDFLTTGAAGAFGLLAGTRRVRAQGVNRQALPPAPPEQGIPYGETRLGLADSPEERDGALYVPKSYKEGEPMPLLTILHGLSGGMTSARSMYPLAEEFGVIILAPESRKLGWGKDAPGFDNDSVFIVNAMRYVNRTLAMDPSHVCLAGISDGATYALTMGLVYGDSFSHIMVFSEGQPNPIRTEGKPKIFIGHGIRDSQMPIVPTTRRTVAMYKPKGYDITVKEWVGGHGAPGDIVRAGFEWFTGKPSAH